MLATAQLNNYIRPLTVHEYQKMSDFGIIDEDEHIELIEGRLIAMPPIGINHVSIVNQLNHLFHQAVNNQAIVQVQSPVYLNNNYMPEPDISLAKYRADFYRSRRIKAEDILLIVEVSDSSFRYDSEIKIPSYAQFSIPEVWIIDVNSQSLIRHYHPVNGTYSHIETIAKLEQITLTTLPDITLNLTNLF
jgi:Uma2 family endonuclease